MTAAPPSNDTSRTISRMAPANGGEQGSCLMDQLRVTEGSAGCGACAASCSCVEMTVTGKTYLVAFTAVSATQLKFAASSVLPAPFHFATFGNTQSGRVRSTLPSVRCDAPTRSG